jgi:hypothetical protein
MEDIMKINLDIKTSTDLCRYLEPNKARVFFYHDGPHSYEGNAVNMGKLIYGVDFYKKLLWTDVSPWLRDNKILSEKESLMVSTGSVFPEKAYVLPKWRRKAGCSCGCSSGIILPRELFQNDQPIDVHVTVSEE